MAGAAGDALGYEVEFMSRRSILSHFGGQGITKFALDCNGKALISDDTQMTSLRVASSVSMILSTLLRSDSGSTATAK